MIFFNYFLPANTNSHHTFDVDVMDNETHQSA